MSALVLCQDTVPLGTQRTPCNGHGKSLEVLYITTGIMSGYHAPQLTWSTL